MPGNLPQDLTPFVGRRRESSDVRSLLVTSRVLTLIGTGGVGKTRLALAVAAERQRAFPDGVWYAPLDGIEEESLLVAHVSTALGHRHEALDGDLTEGLARSLRDKRLLLVLDNCEHLVEGVARLAEAIARACPSVRILATSRTPLRSAGESTYQVLPLRMPQGADATDRDVDSSDAVRFFVDRARRVLPEFDLTDANRAGVHMLVRRLDRLPLALELAAVRLRCLTVHQIVERLDATRSMLNWGSRSAPFRQQTVRSSLQWSADLCSTQERRLWARLSVFRGTFDLDAVEAVCSDDSTPEDLLDLLQGLVERSIVVREDHGAVVRYSMLRVIRHFGQELLDEDAEDAPRLEARHMSWYLGLIARADAEWNTGRQAHWLHALPLEHKNVVQALATAADHAATVDVAAEAVCGLWRYYWWARGWHAEGTFWVERCARLVTTPVLRARLLLLGSLLAWTIGDGRAGAGWLREGQEVTASSGDRLARGLAAHVLGDVELYRGNAAAATAHFHRALSTFDRASTSSRVDTLLMLTLAYAVVGDVDGAEAAHRETLATLSPAERFQRSYSLLFLGEALRCRGSADQALVTVRDALRAKAGLEDPFGVAWTFEILAQIACDRRRYESAAFLLGAAGRMWRAMGVDESTPDRLQIRGSMTRDRVRAALGPSGAAEHCRRGEQAELGTAVAAALEEGTPPDAARTDRGLLTARESEVTELVALGLTNKQIAARLVIAQRTADAHVQNVLTKLDFHSRAQIAAWVTARSDRGR